MASVTVFPDRIELTSPNGVVTHRFADIEAGTLYADFHSDGGKWHVRGWTPEASGPDEVVATIEPLGIFRMLLARFGRHYMTDQLYGGYSERRLSQRGRTQGFAIYMANDQWRGYWVKTYCATAIFQPAERGDL